MTESQRTRGADDSSRSGALGGSSTPADLIRVVALSPKIVLGDVDGNLARIRAAILGSASREARLLVLPELATSGYLFTGKEEAQKAALSASDKRWAAVQEVIPENAVVVVGYVEQAGDRLFNTAAVLTRTARLADYRKSHLWAAETLIFDRGSAAGVVVTAPFGRLGVALCYDNEFPEVPRKLALAGADVMALPVNWPLVTRPEGEHAPEIIQAMAAARSSRLPVVIADRWGAERGVEWTDGTAVIDEQGWVVASRTVMGATAEVSLAAARDKSLAPHNHLFDDRRAELY